MLSFEFLQCHRTTLNNVFTSIWEPVTLESLLEEEEDLGPELELEVAEELVEMEERSVSQSRPPLASQSRPLAPPPRIGILKLGYITSVWHLKLDTILQMDNINTYVHNIYIYMCIYIYII